MQNNDKIYSEKRKNDCKILPCLAVYSVISDALIIKSCLFVFEFQQKGVKAVLLHPEAIEIRNIVLVNAERKSDWAFPLHAHDQELEISLVQSGGGAFYCQGVSYPMSAGDLIVKNAGVIHGEHTSLERPMHQVCVSLSGVEELPGQPGHLLPRFLPPVIASGEDFPLLSAIFSYLADHWRENERLCRQLLLPALEMIKNRIEKLENSQSHSQPDAKAAQAVSDAAEWLDGNYMQKITLELLAERFFISPYYLERKFKEYTGYSINQYVIDRRMGEAQRMLIFEEKPIKEIALSVGYDNLQYFYATFKKYAGKTPADFRAEYR